MALQIVDFYFQFAVIYIKKEGGKMKKGILIANLCLVIAILAGDVAYIITGALLAKALTSAGFVILGAINLFYAIKNKAYNLKFCVVMLIGLFMAMLGDILLEINFIVGAILFAVGHVFFFISYCFLKKFKWVDLFYGLAIFVPAALFITLAPVFDFGGTGMMILCVIYALIISIMTGKAVSNYVRANNMLNLIIMIGSILFTFSDIMLLFNVFASLPVVGILCLVSYYPAECLLAFSIFKAGEAK